MAAQQVDGGADRDEVFPLVRPRQVEGYRAEGVVADTAQGAGLQGEGQGAFGAFVYPVGEGERSPALRSAGGEDGGAFRIALSDENGDARFDDACLLGGDLRYGGAEQVAVVEADVGDDAQGGPEDVRGVEPASQSGFYDGHLHSRLGEVAEGHCGRHLEVGESPVDHLLSVPVEERGDGRFRYHPAVHADALSEVVQVGGGVESGAIAGRLQDRGQHVGHGTFAVGAGYVDGEVVALGLAHGAAHRSDCFQTALVGGAACGLERNEISVEKIDGFLVGHGVVVYVAVFGAGVSSVGHYSSIRWLRRRKR